MQIAGPGVEAVMARVVEVSTRPSPLGEAGEAGQVASLEALCDLWRESRGDQVPHICATLTNAVIHLVFLPRVTTVVTTILEEEGLFDRVGLHSYCWELMPLDHDVLSMELPHLFGDIFLQDDTTQISVVAR